MIFVEICSFEKLFEKEKRQVVEDFEDFEGKV